MKTFDEIKVGDRIYLWLKEDIEPLFEAEVTGVKHTQYDNIRITFNPSFKEESYIIIDGILGSTYGSYISYVKNLNIFVATTKEDFIEGFRSKFDVMISANERKIRFYKCKIAEMTEEIDLYKDLMDLKD